MTLCVRERYSLESMVSAKEPDPRRGRREQPVALVQEYVQVHTTDTLNYVV